MYKEHKLTMGRMKHEMEESSGGVGVLLQSDIESKSWKCC
jgi:hypothetical protein